MTARQSQYRCSLCGSAFSPRRVIGQALAWECPNRTCVHYSVTEVKAVGRLPAWVIDVSSEYLTRPLVTGDDELTRELKLGALAIVFLFSCALLIVGLLGAARWFATP